MTKSRVFTQALLVLSVLALGFAGYLLVLSPIQQDRSQTVLYAQARQTLAEISMPTGGKIDPGTPVALLEIPGLQLSQVVVEGTAGSQLAEGPGHRRTSPLPGQPGTSVLLGRAQTFGAPFKEIGKLQPGDEVTATTGQGKFTYRVDSVRREGDPIPPALARGGSRMVLVSAEGGDLTGPERTLFVDTTLIGEASAAPGGRPRTQLPEEEALSRDTGVLIELVLWLQVLVLAVGFFAWARIRWGRWETWLVGVPIVVAATWQVYHAGAVALLPNLV
ncbi:sortase domain-containing protein [Kibdelosporangium aridum]|uniref:LPXTG-site transpeptidase (Sortase) family protein n=1 Tax=Kibdelosporangium aridum TaxID=2030 RepID=A0A1W2F0Q6_KIBAR|nr:sortase [Kibdelosporangium aridum]SMD15036.1 LPXTG-site transpeptidase (sortase) family protein [Kibdelosporangium aridum]